MFEAPTTFDVPKLRDNGEPQVNPSLMLDLYLETRQGEHTGDSSLFHVRVEGIMGFKKLILVPKLKSA